MKRIYIRAGFRQNDRAMVALVGDEGYLAELQRVAVVPGYGDYDNPDIEVCTSPSGGYWLVVDGPGGGGHVFYVHEPECVIRMLSEYTPKESVDAVVKDEYGEFCVFAPAGDPEYFAAAVLGVIYAHFMNYIVSRKNAVKLLRQLGLPVKSIRIREEYFVDMTPDACSDVTIVLFLEY